MTSYKLNDPSSQETQAMQSTIFHLPADTKSEASCAVDRLRAINFVAVKACQSFHFLQVRQQNSNQNEYCAHFNQCGRKSLHGFVSVQNRSWSNSASMFLQCILSEALDGSWN